jgi:phospholipase/lecithinase/hemolysin
MKMLRAIFCKSMLPASTVLAWIFISLLGFGGMDAVRATVVVSANLTQTAAGSPNTYSITLNNTSTSGESITEFLFAGNSGQNFMSVAPTNITAPAGWTGTVTHTGTGDGYGIEFITSTASLTASSKVGVSTTLTGFSFQSSASIAQLQGLTSVAFTSGGTVQTTLIPTFQPKLIIIGDSDDDEGNTCNISGTFNGLTITPTNYTDYPLDPLGNGKNYGKFTDGPDTIPSTSIVGIWADQFATLQVIPGPGPSTAGGGDYAFGGAVTGTGVSYKPGLQDEVNTFLKDFPTPSPSSIYVIQGGGNDLFNAAAAGTSLSAAEATAISNIKSEIGQLATAGAKNFIWFDQGPLGSSPEGATLGTSALNAAAVQYRVDWSAAIPALEAAYPGITITGVDAYAQDVQILAHPLDYGFTNETTPSQGQSVNPDTYVFWDEEHRTTAVQALTADQVWNDYNLQPQAITFPALNSQQVPGTSVTLNATVSSGEAVTYVITGPATLTGSTLTFTGTGIVTVEADQAGNGTYAPAIPVIQTLNVFEGYTFGTQVQSTPSDTLTYNSSTGVFQYTGPADTTDDKADIPLTGSAATSITTSAGWTVSLTVNLSARSLTSTSSLTPVAAMGIYILDNDSSSNSIGIRLDQANNAGQNSVSSDIPANTYGTVAIFSDKVSGTQQTTTPLGGQLIGSGASDLFISSGTSTSPVTEPIGAVSGQLTLSYNASTTTVTGYYNGTAVGSFQVPAAWGTNPPLTLVVVGFSEEEAAVPAGTDTGNSFNAGLSQTITFPAPASQTVGAAPFTLGATASSGLPVIYSLVSGPATLSGVNNDTVTVTGTGTVVIQASQVGNSTYAAAPNVSQSFSVGQGTQAITFPAIATQQYPDPDSPFTLNATASSGLPVLYSYVSGPASLSGTNNDTVTITGTGTVVLQASQAGNGNYLAANNVEQSFTVASPVGFTGDPTADPENDGVPNLLKYLYDIDPTVPMTPTDRDALPTVGKFTIGTTPYLTLTFRQYALETGITINVQTSPDLQTWTTVATEPSPSIVQIGTDLNTSDPIMRAQVPLSGTAEFIRLKVTSP